MRLPARLRWTTPLRQKIELAETGGASRSGLLVPSREFHAAGLKRSVAFPYNPSLGEGQPALLARVARSGTSHENGHRTAVAGEKSFLSSSSRPGLS